MAQLRGVLVKIGGADGVVEFLISIKFKALAHGLPSVCFCEAGNTP
jgi:hypothetical protein